MSKNSIDSLYWLAMVLLLLYFAYFRGWIFVNFESLEAQKIEKLLQEEGNVTLLDVRTTLEFEREHIANAIHIPLQDLENNLTILSPFKMQKIIVYCHSGSRSIRAARTLKSNGFTPINLDGGLIEWKKAHLRLITTH